MINVCFVIYKDSDEGDQYSHHELLCYRRNGEIKRIMIDADVYDFLILMDYKWSINKGGYGFCKNLGYLHHYVMKFHDIDLYHTARVDKMVIDHINRNKLDNRRTNLRWVTPAGNAINRSLAINNTSGYSNLKQNKHGEWTLIIKGKLVRKFAELSEAILQRDRMIDLLVTNSFSVQ